MTSFESALPEKARSIVSKDLPHAEHLPGEFYTSAAVLDREVDRIFSQDWLAIGREEEVANAGDYLAVKVVGEPVVVTRDEDGGLNAFSNLCRHRGVFFSSPCWVGGFGLRSRSASLALQRCG